MKNVLLWIVSIFSMLLDAVKKQRQVQVPEYHLRYIKTYPLIVKKGEQKLIIIIASLKNTRAYKSVQEYANNNGMIVIGNYIANGKRNFVLKKVED